MQRRLASRYIAVYFLKFLIKNLIEHFSRILLFIHRNPLSKYRTVTTAHVIIHSDDTLQTCESKHESHGYC